jgi:hypothetical protein
MRVFILLLIAVTLSATPVHFTRLAEGISTMTVSEVSKLGSTLTFAIAVNHEEEFAPFVSSTIPDLITAAPWLADGHARINYAGGDELLAAQLLVDGKPAPRTQVGNSLRVADSAILIPDSGAVGKALKVDLVRKGKAKVTLIEGPEGLRISRGTLSWQPGEKQIGEHEVKLRITVGDIVTEQRAKIAVVAGQAIR